MRVCCHVNIIIRRPNAFNCFIVTAMNTHSNKTDLTWSLFLMVLHISAYPILFRRRHFPHFSSLRRQSSCWWRYPRSNWPVDSLSYSWHDIMDDACDGLTHAVNVVCRVLNRFLNSSWNTIYFDHICVVSTPGGLLVIPFSFQLLRPVWWCS